MNDKQIIIQYLVNKKGYSRKEAKIILVNRVNTTLKTFRLLLVIL